jgi:hypothetical protein
VQVAEGGAAEVKTFATTVAPQRRGRYLDRQWLLVGWLLAALVLLGMDGAAPRLPRLGWAGERLLGLGLAALVRQQLAPFCFNRPLFPERYRVADDLRHSPEPSSSRWPKQKPQPDGSRRRWTRPPLPSWAATATPG